MTAGKPSSPMARALAKVAGTRTEDETAPVAAGAPTAGRPAGAPVNAAAAAPPAPKGSATRNGASPAPGSMSPAVAAASGFPTAPPVGPAAAAGAGPAGSAAYGTGSSTAYGAGAPTQATSPTQAQARPAAAPAPASTGRRVRLTVARVDPWSVMKISFLVSVAIGIAFVVMVAVLWLILDGMGVFTSVNRTISDVAGANSTFNLMDYIALPRVMSLAVVVGVIDVILLTALSTLGAFLYNVCSSLVGGLQLTLSDD